MSKKIINIFLIFAMGLSANEIIESKKTDIINEASSPYQIIDDVAGYKFINISKADITRIYCESSEIKSIVFSKEKEMEIEQNGQNAFIKISKKVTTTGDKIETQISNHPREVFLECGEKMYSFVMIPKDIPSQTIILKSLYSPDIEIAKQTEKSSDYETTLSNLIKDAYKTKLPSGFSIKTHNILEQDFQELRLSKVKSYIGSEYEIIEYTINAKKDISLEEKVFLGYFKNPLAVSIEKLSIKNGENVRMFVVLRNGK